MSVGIRSTVLDFPMNDDRVSGVAQAFGELGYDGIIAFDANEPEFHAFSETVLDIGTERHAALLGILAGSQDFQLAGNAQLFWEELETSVAGFGRLDSLEDVRTTMDRFMDRPVNARFNNMKRGRLEKLYASGFPRWFIETYGEVEPLRVWEELADGLENPMRRKTVVLAMKVYDLVHLIAHDEYLDLPADIPIPCDLQVERVARTSGIVDDHVEDGVAIMDAWAAVASRVGERVGRSVSLLRIDSVVWQAGQHIGRSEPDEGVARRALVEHFEAVGVGARQGNRLAEELTAAM